MLERDFGYRITEGDTTSSDFYAALNIDVDVELERDTWVRKQSTPEMDIQLTGRLNLQKAPAGEIQIFRSIEVLPQRSFIRQFGRRFDIGRGTITFNGPLEEMQMDLEADYEVQSRRNAGTPEATITLSLTGRLDDLKVTLGSDPQMENTDIVSYIATGRPADQALQFGGGGSDEGLLSQGGALAANQIAGAVESFAEAELGLDVVEIQQDGLRGTQLIAGSYVSPRVYIGLSQPIVLNSSEERTAGTKPTEVTVEYELFEWLLLRLIGGTETSAVRVSLTGHYAFR
jgi:translocation and assembly module TamB